MRRFLKIETVCNFCNIQPGIFQEGFALYQQSLVDNIFGTFPGELFYRSGQVIGRNMKLVGIITHVFGIYIHFIDEHFKLIGNDLGAGQMVFRRFVPFENGLAEIQQGSQHPLQHLFLVRVRVFSYGMDPLHIEQQGLMFLFCQGERAFFGNF